MTNILVIEDDPTVLMFLEEGLADRGFSVISARSSGEALNMLSNDMWEIGAVVADIRLGNGIDGWELARCAREITPDLPIVYVTGDSYGDFDSEGVPNSLILKKPFTRIELSDALRSLIGQSGRTAPSDDRPAVGCE